MSIKSELHEAILRKGGKIPTHGGIAAALDELNRLPSGGGVSSWNDLTDKPFGIERGVVLPEMTATITEDSENAITTPFTLINGDTYTVSWNGEEYSSVATEVDNGEFVMTAIGNMAAMDGEDTGEPFVIASVPEDVAESMGGMYGMFMPLDESTEVTFSISGEVVKPLDAKYLPDGTPGIENSDEVIMADTYVEVADGQGLITTPIGELVADGRYYNVTLNGVTYICRARVNNTDENFVAAIGCDNSGLEGSEDYNLPFMIAVLSPALAAQTGATVMLNLYYGNTSGTIGIKGWSKVRKMDERCLPEIPGVFIVRFNHELISTSEGAIYTPDTTISKVYAEYLKNKVILAYVDTGTMFFATYVSNTQVYFERLKDTFNATAESGQSGKLVRLKLIWTEGFVREMEISTEANLIHNRKNAY